MEMVRPAGGFLRTLSVWLAGAGRSQSIVLQFLLVILFVSMLPTRAVSAQYDAYARAIAPFGEYSIGDRSNTPTSVTAWILQDPSPDPSLTVNFYGSGRTKVGAVEVGVLAQIITYTGAFGSWLGSADAVAQIHDAITISSLGLDGTTGTFEITYGTPMEQYIVRGTTSLTLSHTVVLGSASTSSGPTLTGNFVFGQPFGLALEVRARAELYTGIVYGPDFFLTGATLSLGWGGFLSVRDADGNPLQVAAPLQTRESYSDGLPMLMAETVGVAYVSSDSGVDYTQSYQAELLELPVIPEPSTLVLCVFSLLLLAVGVCRRKTSSSLSKCTVLET